MKEGSFVICVDDGNWTHPVKDLFNKLPVKGQVYRVSFIHSNYYKKNGPPGVSVEGIIGKVELTKTHWGTSIPVEWHFKICRFKEIDLLSNNVEVSIEVENENRVTRKDTIEKLVLTDI
jgi:hypothetical protein